MTDSAPCGGRSCIRGLRIWVSKALDLLGAGLSHQQVLEELKRLTEEDTRTYLVYKSRRINQSTARVA